MPLETIILFVIAGFVVLSILLNLFIYLFQDWLIFQGRNIPANHVYDFDQDFEELYLEPETGARLHFIHFKVNEPKGVILYYHGNRADLRRWGRITSKLTAHRYDVFVMDYRGYGKSLGLRTEAKLYSDAQLVCQYVKDHFDYKRYVLFGRSLGSAVAVDLATKHQFDQLILETPLAHIKNALYRYRWLLFPQIIGRYQFDTIHKVSQINCPTVIVHGTRDEVIPLKFARALYDGLATKDKKIIEIHKGGHNNLNNFEEYQETLKTTLN